MLQRAGRCCACDPELPLSSHPILVWLPIAVAILPSLTLPLLQVRGLVSSQARGPHPWDGLFEVRVVNVVNRATGAQRSTLATLPATGEGLQVFHVSAT